MRSKEEIKRRLHEHKEKMHYFLRNGGIIAAAILSAKIQELEWVLGKRDEK